MKIITLKDYQSMSRAAAEETARYINAHPGALLCLAAGQTPEGMFAELIRMQREGKTDVSSVYYAELDEWVGLGPEDRGSCVQVMNDAFYKPAGIATERIHLFNGLDCDTTRQCGLMEQWIRKRGGIGLTVLGVGMNGHIGFNEPGAPGRWGCHVTELDGVTQSVSVKYFGSPRKVTHGITVGWVTLKEADRVILIASGESKARIIGEALRGDVKPDVPASLLRDHPDLTVVLDEQAAAQLSIKTAE